MIAKEHKKWIIHFGDEKGKKIHYMCKSESTRSHQIYFVLITKHQIWGVLVIHHGRIKRCKGY